MITSNKGIRDNTMQVDFDPELVEIFLSVNEDVVRPMIANSIKEEQ